MKEQGQFLQNLGWSRKTVQKIFKAEIQQVSQEAGDLESIQIFGSPLFKRLWQLESRKISPQRAQQLLELAMASVGMPEELTGDLAETQALLSRIDLKLAPHDTFWLLFARTLQRAFPYDDFIQRDGNQRLKRQLHQFRYVISCQQAQWVRNHFREPGMTDAEALAAYLKSRPGLPYSFGESSRLHNKAYISPQGLPASVLYPDGHESQANVKILLAFHTEFILDKEGCFLNVLDPEGLSQNGLVNGASFNYGNRNRPGNLASHTRYDVKSPGIWDPDFRRKTIQNGGCKFQSPQNNGGPLGYRSAASLYSQDGRSAKQAVDDQVRRFKQLLGRPLFLLRFWGRCRRFGQALLHIFK